MRYFLCLHIVLLFSSCQTDYYGNKRPSDLIPRDTFVLILEELSLVESHVQDTYTHVGVYKDLMKKSGESILDKYHVDPNRFERTMDYYGTRQEELQSIYSQVLDSLNKEASALPEEKSAIQDSSNTPLLMRLPQGVR